MRTRPFGETGFDVSIVGQGTWDLPESGSARDDAGRALLRGLDLGMTHIDTAEMYGAGNVERVVGAALAAVPRERYFIVSKVLPSHADYDGVLRACEASLQRLRVDYVDCYLLHWPSSVPLEETMRALETLVERGLARSIGVSNFDVDEMLEARSYLRNVPLACNQVLYHLRERGIEHRLIPQAQRDGIAVVAYTPFGRARMSGAQTAVLERVAEKYGVSPHAVQLAFLTRHENVFAIPKAATLAHVEANAGAGDLQLDRSDAAVIDAAFPVGDDGPLATL